MYKNGFYRGICFRACSVGDDQGAVALGCSVRAYPNVQCVESAERDETDDWKRNVVGDERVAGWPSQLDVTRDFDAAGTQRTARNKAWMTLTA